MTTPLANRTIPSLAVQGTVSNPNQLSSHFQFMKANANLLRTDEVTEQIAREREEICNLLFGVWKPEGASQV